MKMLYNYETQGYIRQLKAYMPSWTKEKGVDLWFRTSKGRKAIHIEIERHVFRK